MILEQGSIDALIDRHLKITWNLISFCNFHCPYCLDINTKRSINYHSEDEVKYAIDNLLRLQFNSFEFYLLGGEPTLYPHLELIVDRLLSYERVKRVYIMTNGSNWIDLPNDERLFIVVSIHPLSADKIKIWGQKRIFYNLLAYPKTFDMVKKIYSEKHIDEITVVRMPPNFENIFPYSDDQREWIISYDPNQIKPQQLYHGVWKFESGAEEEQPKYSMMEFNQEKYLSFQNMFCFNNSLTIQSDGRFRYTCYNSKLSKYSIFKETIKYSPDLIRCPYRFCNCAAMLNIMKVRDSKRATELFSGYFKN